MRHLPGRLAPLLALTLSAGILAEPLGPPPEASPEVVLPGSLGIARPALRQEDGLVRFHRLANRLSVVLQPQRSVPAVALQLWVQVGHADEGPAERGCLAILEELLKLRCQDVLQRAPPSLRASLASLSVEVGRDATVVSLEGSSRGFDGLLRALALTVRSPQVSPERFRSARSLALETLRHRRRDGDQVALAALHSLAFRVHPYRNHPLTARDALEIRSREEVQAFLRRELVPNCARLVVLGAVDEAEAARTVIREFGPWKSAERRSSPKIIEPKMVSHRLGTVVGPDHLQRLAVGFLAPPFRGEDAPAVSVLCQALDPSSGTGVARVLQQSLPEGVSLRCEYVPARDPSLLSFLVGGREFDHEVVIRRIAHFIARIREVGIPEPDLVLAKDALQNQALARTQSYADQARALGLTAILSEPEPPFPVLERVMALSSSDVQRTALSYLNPDAFAAALVLPADSPRVTEVPPPPEPTRKDLESGMRLVRLDAGPPDVATAVLRASLRGIELREGEVAALRSRLLQGLSRNPTASGWVIGSPLPGLDRDALTFEITSSRAAFPRALQVLLRTLMIGELPGKPVERPEPERWRLLVDHAADLALARLFDFQGVGVPRYPQRTMVEFDPSRLEELRSQVFCDHRMLLAVTADPDTEALDEVLAEIQEERPASTVPALPLAASTAELPSRPPVAHHLRGGDAVVVLAARIDDREPGGHVAARTLAEVMGGGPASRLGRRIRAVSGLGFEAGAAYQALEGSHGLLVAWIGTSEEGVELAELVLREEVTRLTLEPVGTEELVAAREAIRLRELSRRQSTQGVAAILARQTQRHTAADPQEVVVVDALTIQEMARASFSEARIETFMPRLALGRRRGSPGCTDPGCDGAEEALTAPVGN